MGIRKYAVSQTAVLQLRSADDELMVGDDGLPMEIELFGPGSKEFARAQAVQQNRMLERLKKKGKVEQTAEEKAREAAEFLAECTKSFSENVAGEDYLGLTGRKLYEAVYADREVGFVAEQANKHLGDWANFTQHSAKS